VEEVRETMWDVEEEAETPMMRRSSSSRNVDETHPIDGGFDQGSELGGGGRRRKKKKKGGGGRGGGRAERVRASRIQNFNFVPWERRGAIIKDGGAGQEEMWHCAAVQLQS
jgi:hypothetical protein